MWTRLFLVLSVNLLLVLGQNVEYKGYRVYNVQFQTQEQQNKLHLLKSDVVVFWRKPSVNYGVVGQAMVPPSHFDWFERRLEELDVDIDVAIPDVYDFITERMDNARASRNDEFSFEAYYRYDEILNYLYGLQETYSNSTTISLEVIESNIRTEENRPLVYLKLARTNSNAQTPVAIVEAAVNPKEWATIPSSLYVVDKLLSDEGTALLDDFEWVIIPVANPDGYEYTHTNLRLWDKNRSTRSHLGFICPGANINRNFDIDWSVSDSSTTPCSHLFSGVGPFSEEESQFLRSILEEYGSRTALYFSLQNTGGFISYPWQFEFAASGMFRQHLLLARDMSAAMNNNYTTGIGAIIFGDRASGTSIDYVRNRNVLYTYTIDIVPIGDSGVMIPEVEIVNVAEDVWRAIYVAVTGIDRYI